MRDDTSFQRPRYLVHYADVGGVERGLVMRRFDLPLQIGQEFTGIDGLCRVVRIEETSSPGGLGNVWVEPA